MVSAWYGRLKGLIGVSTANPTLVEGRRKWGGPGRPTFLALFMELRTFNTCRLWCDTDFQACNRRKAEATFLSVNLEGHQWWSVLSASVIGLTGGRGLTTRNTRIVPFYLSYTAELLTSILLLAWSKLGSLNWRRPLWKWRQIYKALSIPTPFYITAAI